MPVRLPLVCTASSWNFCNSGISRVKTSPFSTSVWSTSGNRWNGKKKHRSWNCERHSSSKRVWAVQSRVGLNATQVQKLDALELTCSSTHTDKWRGGTLCADVHQNCDKDTHARVTQHSRVKNLSDVTTWTNTVATLPLARKGTITNIPSTSDGFYKDVMRIV